MEEQICFKGGETLGAIAGGIVVTASAIVNFVPDPDKISNPILRFLSRAVHFIALDIVTANKPK